MILATLGVTPSDRAKSFTLHRSETVAHSAGLLDRKNSAASSRARGRSEGFACKHSEYFKPLGRPVSPEKVSEMHNSVLAKVAQIQAAVSIDANSQHQDKKDKERNRRMEEMMRKEIVERSDRAQSPDAKDAVKDEQAGTEEGSLEAEREEMLILSRLPHALYGKDLPRCGQLQERQEKDGFKHLKHHIKDSFRRVEQVKSDVDAAFEARKENMQLMLQTPRQKTFARPASPGEEPSSAFLTSLDMPQSAREKRQAKRRPSKGMKRGANWLPSLAEYLADPGVTLLDRPERGEVKQTDHGKHKDIVKEIVGQLIPLPKDPKGPKANYGNILDEGKVGYGKGRRLSRRKLFEKDLNEAWKDKNFYKRCTPFIPQRDAEEYRQLYRNDEHKLATIERFLKDLGFTEELKDSKAEVAGAGLATSLGDALSASGGAVPADPGYAVMPVTRGVDGDEGGKGLQRNNEQTRTQDPVVPLARARFKAIRQKAMAQLREPEDPSSSSLALLRLAVYDYQSEREKARQVLQDKLETQEKSRMADKLPPLRLKDSRTGAAMDEPADNRQHLWYHSLLEQVRAQGDLASVSKAVYLLLDSVKVALDDTGEFTPDDFWEVLSEVQSEEITTSVAALLASMIRSSGLNSQDLERALQQRGDVAAEALNVVAS